MDKTASPAQPPLPWTALAAIVAGFFLFLVLVHFLYAADRPETVADGGLLPEERLEILRERKEDDRLQLTTYDWIDREAGLIRLPIDRAMELTLEEINRGRRAGGATDQPVQ